MSSKRSPTASADRLILPFLLKAERPLEKQTWRRTAPLWASSPRNSLRSSLDPEGAGTAGSGDQPTLETL